MTWQGVTAANVVIACACFGVARFGGPGLAKRRRLTADTLGLGPGGPPRAVGPGRLRRDKAPGGHRGAVSSP